MVKHMIIWKLKDDAPSDAREKIKCALEGLVGQIDGLIEMHILTNPLDSSNSDLMMDSLLESKDALDFYQSHPKHLEIASTLVRPVASVRLCFDFEL